LLLPKKSAFSVHDAAAPVEYCDFIVVQRHSGRSLQPRASVSGY
jgi:hypothetical protein